MINCTKCGELKNETQFRPRPKLKRGYNSWCRECENLETRKKYKPKPKKVVIKDNEYTKLNNLKRMLKHRYNLEYSDYLLMYEQQNKCCAICNEPKELGGHKGLQVDHSHETNEVRGLLCRNCNVAIGYLKENKEIILNIINYLNLLY